MFTANFERFARGARTTAFCAVSALALLAAAGAAQAEPRTFKVQAQPLASALKQLADQANIEILFDSALTAGLDTSGVNGSKEPAEALGQLLRGSGLSFDWSGPGTVIIRRSRDGRDGPVGGDRPAATPGEAAVVDSIVVVGSRAAQAAAMNRERQASGVTNIVSSDQVGRFPDENAAEAVRRLPGVSIVTNRGEGRFVSIRGAEPSFIGVSVDGVNLPSQEDDRSVALDTVPAEQLGSIEVSKTTTPNQDAEGIGGRVNLVTKSPFDFKDGYFSADLGAGSSQQNDDVSQRGSAAFAKRFGSENQFGVVASASYSKFPRGLENANVSDWSNNTVGGVSGLTPKAVEIEDRGFERERVGLSARLEYRPTDDSRYYLAGRYNTFNLSEYRYRTRMDLNKPTAASDVENGAFTDATYANHQITKRWDFVETDQVSYNVSLGGENAVAGGKLDYQLSYATATEDSVGEEVEFNGTGFTTRLVSRGYGFDMTPAGGLDRTNAANYHYFQSDHRTFDKDDSDTALQVNWARQADWLGLSGELKVGFKASDRDKSSDNQRTRFTGLNSGTLLMSDPRVAGAAPPLDSLDGYQFGPGFSDPAMHALVSDLSIFKPNIPKAFQENILGDFDVKEKIRAGYVMYTGQVGAWTFIPGVRVETTETQAGFWLDQNTGQAVDDPSRYTFTTEKRDYTDWFPSLTVRYEPRDDLILRAAVTRTISRPKFSDLAGAREVDETDFLDDPQNPIDISQGNPNLEPIRSLNFDFRADWYFSRLGMLSGALFHKRLDGPIYEQQANTTYEGDPAQLTQPLNAGKGRITGVELAFTRQFDFLPGALSGLGVYANATFVKSSVDVPDRLDEHLPLFDQSDLVGNLALTYQAYGFDGRIALNHQGGYLESLNAPGTDSYVDDRSTVDFSLRYAVTRRVNVFVEGENLTDAPLRHYKGSSARWINSESYGRFLLAGVSLTF